MLTLRDLLRCYMPSSHPPPSFPAAVTTNKSLTQEQQCPAPFFPSLPLVAHPSAHPQMHPSCGMGSRTSAMGWGVQHPANGRVTPPSPLHSAGGGYKHQMTSLPTKLRWEIDHHSPPVQRPPMEMAPCTKCTHGVGSTVSCMLWDTAQSPSAALRLARWQQHQLLSAIKQAFPYSWLI